MMNVSPRSENFGNIVGLRAERGPGLGGVRLAQKPGSGADVTPGVESDEDEDFMALMNADKKKEAAPPAFAAGGLPGGYGGTVPDSFTIPAASPSFSESTPSPDAGFSSGPSAGFSGPSAGFSSDANPSGNFRSLEEEKQHYMYKIQRLQARFPGRRVGIETPLDELKFEYDRLRRQSEMAASVKFQRRALMATVSGIEYVNKSFNPLGLHLDGWSEQVMDSLEDFDQTFEQLHERYQGTADVSPEWNLFIMLLGSGFMFHLSNSLFKSVLPNVNDVARNNPDLMNQIASAMGTAMNQQNPQQPRSDGGNPSQMGASLAMQAMQQKLRPQVDDSIIEDDDETESLPSNFQQAASLRRVAPPPPRQMPVLGKPEVEELSDISDLSSDMSLSEDGAETRTVAQKRPAPRGGNGKRKKASVSINL